MILKPVSFDEFSNKLFMNFTNQALEALYEWYSDDVYNYDEELGETFIFDDENIEKIKNKWIEFIHPKDALVYFNLATEREIENMTYKDMMEILVNEFFACIQCLGSILINID